jgi:large subunit ribosomal protein L18
MNSRRSGRELKRVRRHLRVRKKAFGDSERPRLVVHRSLKNMQAQVVNDETGVVLVGVSTLAPELESARTKEGVTKRDLSREAGKLMAERAKSAGITRVVFDRGGYRYHGRVAAFAEGAREGGLEF